MDAGKYREISLVKLSVKQNCLLCQQSSARLICDYCRTDLETFSCAEHQQNLLNWPKAKRGLKSVKFKTLLALADYQWPLSRLLTGLKFSAQLSNAKALAQLFYQNSLVELSALPEVIIPMPLHNRRYCQRKFNQSIEIAKHLSQLTGIRLDTNLLKRIKKTQPQTTLSVAQRKVNLEQAFALNHGQYLDTQDYTHIVLFDDVVTTGATMDAAYNLLATTFPASRIDVWCICLTLEHQ
ncbi:MAG: ComF family protein [Paraglaciecola sp.]|jgi:ComF family protein